MTDAQVMDLVYWLASAPGFFWWTGGVLLSFGLAVLASRFKSDWASGCLVLPFAAFAAFGLAMMFVCILLLGMRYMP